MALNMMPFKNLWAALFFFMMLNLGLDTIMSIVEYVCAIVEASKFFKKYKIKKSIFRGILCLFLALTGQIFCYGNGFYVTLFFNNLITVLNIYCGLIVPIFVCLKPEVF